MFIFLYVFLMKTKQFCIKYTFIENSRNQCINNVKIHNCDVIYFLPRMWNSIFQVLYVWPKRLTSHYFPHGNKINEEVIFLLKKIHTHTYVTIYTIPEEKLIGDAKGFSHGSCTGMHTAVVQPLTKIHLATILLLIQCSCLDHSPICKGTFI